MEKVLVSVIILNRNGRDMLCKCLEAISKSNYRNLEVIVVDNDSTDGSDAMVKRDYPYVKLIDSNRNLGYSGGNNVGLSASSGNLVFFCNNDVFVVPDTIKKLVTPMLQDQRIGIAGCKVYQGLSKVLQHAGGFLHPSGHGISIGYLEKDDGQYDYSRDVDWVSGAAFMVRRSIIDQIGWFETAYFPIYHDEIDLCYRNKKSGFKVVYIPDSVVYHCEQKNAEAATRAAYLRNRNRLIFVIKNYTLRELLSWVLWEAHLFFINGVHTKAWLKSRLPMNRVIKPLLKSYIWVLMNLSQILKIRSTYTYNKGLQSSQKLLHE